MYLQFAGVEVLGVSPGVVILLEHPAIYRQNVVNKNIVLISSNNHF